MKGTLGGTHKIFMRIGQVAALVVTSTMALLFAMPAHAQTRSPFRLHEIAGFAPLMSDSSSIVRSAAPRVSARANFSAVNSPVPMIDAPSAVKEREEIASESQGPLIYSAFAQEQPLIAIATASRPNGPLTARQKFQIFERHTYSPMTFVSSAFNAALNEVTGDHRAFGEGAQGYGKQLGAAVADDEASVFFSSFLFPAITHQDPRYFRMQSGGTMNRAWYAMTRTFITRNEEGDTTVNTSHILARFAASGLTNAYYPANEAGPRRTARRAVSSLLNDSAMNLLREFWPDLRRHVLPQRFRPDGQ